MRRREFIGGLGSAGAWPVAAFEFGETPQIIFAIPMMNPKHFPPTALQSIKKK
jgi:hypothetical protein